MTGSPFSNTLGRDPDDSTFQDVLTTKRSDTTIETGARPADADTESSVGVERTGESVHVAGQDETAGDEPSGTDTKHA